MLQAATGQSPARQASLGAGIPNSVPASTVNKVCSSGMKAMESGAQAIRGGDAACVVVGGMESMSRVPYTLPNESRSGGLRMGHKQLGDLMISDGLWDVCVSFITFRRRGVRVCIADAAV